ncbi:MAG TPA: leucine-rich repeat domain-containing protein [Bacilli bacterium]|nr:leucine-rich repeat domain-containing protein [Bacilli bacterium]
MNNKRGFTLIELVAVIVILVIILLIAIPKISDVVTNSKKNSLVSSAKILAKAIQSDSISSGEAIYKLDSDGILYRCFEETCTNPEPVIIKYNGKLKSKYNDTVILVASTNGEVTLNSGTICDEKEKYCFEAPNEGLVLKSISSDDISLGSSITTATTTTSTTSTTSVTTTSSGVELLATGDAKKDGTSGSVTYSFYSNGSLIVTGTGDGIMADYAPGEGFYAICTNIFISRINSELEPGAEMDQDTLNFFVYAYITYGVDDFDSFLLFAVEAGETTEEVIREMAEYFFGSDYEYVLDNIAVPTISSVTITGVTDIGNTAFAYLNLSDITIPNSVTTIGQGAFANNPSNSVTITFGNSITDIEGYAFYNITNLETVNLPDSLDNIGIWAFDSCAINSLSLNNGLLNISNNAFSQNDLTSVTIPSSVNTIGASAFADNLLTSVTIEGVSTRFDADWELIGFPPK